MTNFCDGLISIYLLKCILRNSLHVFVARTRMKLKQLSRLRHLRCMVVMVPKMWDWMFLIKRRMKKVKNVRCPLVSVKALYWVYMLALYRSLIQTVGQSVMNVELGVQQLWMIWCGPDQMPCPFCTTVFRCLLFGRFQISYVKDLGSAGMQYMVATLKV